MPKVARPSLKWDCPHCLSNNQGFTFVCGYTDPRTFGDDPPDKYVDHIIFSCNFCHWPVAASLQRNDKKKAYEQPLSLEWGFCSDLFTLIHVKPERVNSDAAPDYTPCHIADNFVEAYRALESRSINLAGVGFEKTLDLATKHLIRKLDPENVKSLIKEDLNYRIDWLVKVGRLTSDLKYASHLLRLGNNEPDNEDERISYEEVFTLRKFTEAFLLSTFTVKGMLETEGITEKHWKSADDMELTIVDNINETFDAGFPSDAK